MRPVTVAGRLTGVESVPANSGQDRPPVLMLHGMMGGAWQFAHLQTALTEAGHRTLAVNYRGHHGSRPADRPARAGVRDYAADALAACTHLGTRPVAVGQSMGGLITLMLAEAGAIRAAVLVCSLPPRGVVWQTRHPRYALRHLVRGVSRRPLLPARGELEALILNRVPPEDRAQVFAQQVPESSRAFLEIAGGGVRVDPHLVTCPVLSITAGHDALVVPRVGRRIARRYNATELHRDGAGHYALVAEPDAPALSAHIVSWIDSVTSSAPGATA